MKMKKLLSAMSLVLGVTMLAGCGAGAGDNSNGASTSSAASTEKADMATSEVTTYKAEDMSKNPVKDRKDTLIIGTESPSGIFNPLYSDTMDAEWINRILFPFMLKPVKSGKDPEPYLAESCKVSDDGLVYTFKIRDNAKWSDGTPVTAKDYAMSLTICCDKSYIGQYDYINGRTKIKGAKEYREGTAETISGIEIKDDKTVSVTLLEPSSSAIYVLGESHIVNSEYYGKYYTHGDTDKLKETYSNPGPTCGPYKFVSYKEGQEVVLEADNNFFLGAPKIKNIIYKVVTEDVKSTMLQSGEIDFTDLTVSQDNIDLAQSAGFIGYQLFPTNGYGHIEINCNKPQFKDKKVRQALTMGLNREKIVQAVYDKYAKVINVPQTEASWAYAKGKNEYKYDLDAAKKLLDDAGWVVGSDGIREKDGVKLAINFTGSANNPVVDSFLSVADSDWKELGVKFTSEIMDFNSVNEKREGDDWDMLFMAWVLTDDANDDVFRTKGAQNKTNYSNAEADALYAEIDKELDQKKLVEDYSKLYTILNDDLPYIYMYQRNDMWGYNDRLKGMDISPYVDYVYSLYTATLEE